jgi:hypothetical protein
MKYPIGIQTFEEIISGGYVYVDKTELVYKLVNSGEYYFLSRPRRFGKSLLTTTLEAYFTGRKDLFHGLAMERLEKDWTVHPVFHLDFSAADYTDATALDSRIEHTISGWEDKYGKNKAEKNFGERFYGVISRAKEQTGQKAVLLIDEYDKPLTDTIGQTDLQDRNRNLLQSIYGVMKRADSSIRFAFLTGVTRYGKLGIYSAANNPDDISMVDDYASICGISEAELHQYFDNEIDAFADKRKVSKDEMYALLKRKYDGYHFCAASEDVYNPFSLLSALKSKSLHNYWFATGTPTYLVKMLKNSNPDLTKFNNEINSTEEGIASFGNGDENIIAALYQGGYLTIKGYDGRRFYQLGFPNEEVADGFVQYLMTEYSGKGLGALDDDFVVLRDAIEADNVDGFMQQIQLIMSQIPFESHEPRMIEANFRNMLFLMMRSAGYQTKIELPVLGGRIDVFFETKDCAYIIECKRDLSAAEALAQIDAKRYADKISTNKKIVKIGANFSTTERNLTEWVVM